SGKDVIKDGFRKEQIGEEIKRREGEKFKTLIDNINERKIVKYSEFGSLNESDQINGELEELKNEYPHFIFNMKPHNSFKNDYFCTVYKGDDYLGGLKGPCSYEKGIEFFKNIIKNYDN
ncbi:MAG: hypothetical protein ACOC3V_01620, partial [bacterium]